MTTSARSEVSRQLALQRVRNRIIEYLELASSLAAQRRYQATAPVSVPNEVVNQWEDWVLDPAFGWEPPVFSREEGAAIATFHQVWDEVARATPNPLPPLEETVLLPDWEKLRSAAESAARVFAYRGRLPEDEEI
jgi:hypothetical protein